VHDHHGLLGPRLGADGRTGDPVGIYIAWNFLEGPAYDVAVGGTTSDTSLVNLTQGGSNFGPAAISGPEAGLLCTVSCTIALSSRFGCALGAASSRSTQNLAYMTSRVGRQEPDLPGQAPFAEVVASEARHEAAAVLVCDPARDPVDT
jgi:hypothetical protein